MKLIGNKIFEKFIYYTIILNLSAMVIESEPSVNENIRYYLNKFELFSIIIFSLEYLIRTFESIKHKLKYNFSFFGIIDLLAILPFYFQTALGIDGRFIRVFRLFRVSRILKLGRFSKSFDLLSKGISNVKNELYLTFFIAFVIF